MTNEATSVRTPGADAPVLVRADSALVRRMGDWTTARRFDVRVRRGQATLDLRSAQIPAGDIEICLDADHGLVNLLVADDVLIEAAGLHWAGRGRLKDAYGSAPDGGRTITITGAVRSGEVRVYRGGMAIWASMFSRGELRRMHREHQESQRATAR
jgi:hypothetical protein